MPIYSHSVVVTARRPPKGPKNTVLSMMILTFDLTLKLVGARDQTRLPCEFSAIPFSGSRDFSYTNRKNTDWWRQKRNLLQFTTCGKILFTIEFTIELRVTNCQISRLASLYRKLGSRWASSYEVCSTHCWRNVAACSENTVKHDTLWPYVVHELNACFLAVLTL